MAVRKRKTGFGPYADRNGRLTPEGCQFLIEHLDQYPNPIRLLLLKWPNLYHTALERGHTFEQINSYCMSATVDAAIHYEPGTASFATYAGWHFRRAVQVEIGLRKPRKPKGTVLHRLGEFAEDIPGRVDENDPERIEWAEALRKKVSLTIQQNEPNERRRRIFAERFGLADGIARGLPEVAEAFGVTRERIRQITLKVIEKIAPELTEYQFS